MEEQTGQQTAKEEPKEQPYKSQDGFVRLPVRRGFTEIQGLCEIVYREDAFICGGYARYMASPKSKSFPASDVDIYCKNLDVFNHLKEKLSTLEVRHENDISLTYKQPKEGISAYHPPIQLIKPLTGLRVVTEGTIMDILTNFDFTVIRVGLASFQEVIADADFEHDEKKGVLRIKNIHCPVSSTLRCMKYVKKGYYLRPFECLKLFIDWQERTDDYRVKLIEFFRKSENGGGFTKEEIDQLEKLLRID